MGLVISNSSKYAIICNASLCVLNNGCSPKSVPSQEHANESHHYDELLAIPLEFVCFEVVVR